ncbi:hypothetical protein EBR78_07485 [bacterium]|nr:hypothetical protein [bacterium]NBX81879.1 hypothetical protein [bacterium]
MNSFWGESFFSVVLLCGIAWGLAAYGEVPRAPESFIYTVEAGKKVILVNPQKAFWKLKNDQTERPGVGKTESWIEKTSGHLKMKGLLASLEGLGGRVGFSLIETAITKPIQRSEGLVFKVKGTPGAWFSVLVKDRQSQQPEGILTFQRDFETDGTEMEVGVRWDEFVPKIRGKKVQGFGLDLFSVHSLSFQISRSQQQKWYETVPLEFELAL